MEVSMNNVLHDFFKANADKKLQFCQCTIIMPTELKFQRFRAEK